MHDLKFQIFVLVPPKTRFLLYVLSSGETLIYCCSAVTIDFPFLHKDIPFACSTIAVSKLLKLLSIINGTLRWRNG